MGAAAAQAAVSHFYAKCSCSVHPHLSLYNPISRPSSMPSLRLQPPLEDGGVGRRGGDSGDLCHLADGMFAVEIDDHVAEIEVDELRRAEVGRLGGAGVSGRCPTGL